MRYRKDNSPRVITAKYAGQCRCCAGQIAAGETVTYYPTMRAIAHVGGLEGNSAKCSAVIKWNGLTAAEKAAAIEKHGYAANPSFRNDGTRLDEPEWKARDSGFVDLDRAYEDQCADICGR